MCKPPKEGLTPLRGFTPPPPLPLLPTPVLVPSPPTPPLTPPPPLLLLPAKPVLLLAPTPVPIGDSTGEPAALTMGESVATDLGLMSEVRLTPRGLPAPPVAAPLSRAEAGAFCAGSTRRFGVDIMPGLRDCSPSPRGPTFPADPRPRSPLPGGNPLNPRSPPQPPPPPPLLATPFPATPLLRLLTPGPTSTTPSPPTPSRLSAELFPPPLPLPIKPFKVKR